MSTTKIIPVQYKSEVDIVTDIVKAATIINKSAVINSEKIIDKYINHIYDFSYSPSEYANKAKEFVRDLTDNEFSDIKENPDLIIDTLNFSFLFHSISVIDEVPTVGMTNISIASMSYDLIRNFERFEILSKIKVENENQKLYLTDPAGNKILVDENVNIPKEEESMKNNSSPECMKDLLLIYIISKHMNDQKDIIQINPRL